MKKQKGPRRSTPFDTTLRDVDRIVRSCLSCPRGAATSPGHLGRRERRRPSPAVQRSPASPCPYEARQDNRIPTDFRTSPARSVESSGPLVVEDLVQRVQDLDQV